VEVGRRGVEGAREEERTSNVVPLGRSIAEEPDHYGRWGDEQMGKVGTATRVVAVARGSAPCWGAGGAPRSVSSSSRARSDGGTSWIGDIAGVVPRVGPDVWSRGRVEGCRERDFLKRRANPRRQVAQLVDSRSSFYLLNNKKSLSMTSFSHSARSLNLVQMRLIPGDFTGMCC
jgi:hypothetical protein